MTSSISDKLQVIISQIGGGSASPAMVFTGNSLSDLGSALTDLATSDAHFRTSLKHWETAAAELRAELRDLAIEDDSYATVSGKKTPLVTEDIVVRANKVIKRLCRLKPPSPFDP